MTTPITNPNDSAGVCPDGWTNNKGLTKREYFAALAMQGLCATVIQASGEALDDESLAQCAVRIADDTIVVLNQPTE